MRKGKGSKLEPISKKQEARVEEKSFKGVDLDENAIVLNRDKKQVYLPGYMRIKLKNFVKMELQNLDVQLNVTIIFTVRYGGILQKTGTSYQLSKELVKQLEEKMVFYFEKDEAMEVAELCDNERNLQVTVKKDEKKQEIKYTVRRIIRAKVYPKVLLTPFERIDSVITVSVQSIKLENLTIHFNLMDHPNNFLKLSYDTVEAFGNYALAFNRMLSLYTDERLEGIEKFQPLQTSGKKEQSSCLQGKEKRKKEYKNWVQKLKQKPFLTELEEAMIDHHQKKDKETKKFDPYKFANFLIPIYKFPSVQILTIFLPLVLLGIINLGIFFQNYEMHDRVASISILLIAFVALVPTLRSELPPTTHLVLIQLLVYLQTYTCVIALSHSFNVMNIYRRLKAETLAKGEDPSKNIKNYSLELNDGQFLTAVVITGLINLVIIVLLLVHKLKWEPEYKVKPLLIEEKEKFVADTWSHSECRSKLQSFLFQNAQGTIQENMFKN